MEGKGKFRIKLGGFATSSHLKGSRSSSTKDDSLFIRDFFKYCAEHEVPPDFYSVHQYGNSALESNNGSYPTTAEKIRTMAKDILKKEIEVINSECGPDFREPNHSRNSSNIAAAWVMEFYLNSNFDRGAYLCIISPYDKEFDEGAFSLSLYTRSGIKKAPAHSLSLLKMLGKKKLSAVMVKSGQHKVGVRATKNEKGNIIIAIWNYDWHAHPDNDYQPTAQNLTLKINGIPWKKIECRRFLIDETRSNPYYYRNNHPEKHQELTELEPLSFTHGQGAFTKENLCLPEQKLGDGSVLLMIIKPAEKI